MPESLASFRHNKIDSERTLCKLGQQVWGFPPGSLPRIYGEHFLELRNDRDVVDNEVFDVPKVNDVIALVERLRVVKADNLGEVLTNITKDNRNWVQDLSDQQHARKAVDFVVRVWLFVVPDLSDHASSLQRSVLKVLSDVQSSTSGSNIKYLTDFSEKSLSRKGGFHIVYTGNMAEHLTLKSMTLRVFGYASILRMYKSRAEADLYPPGFLQETEDTIRLLFPAASLSNARRRKRIGRKHGVDIETALDKAPSLDLADYPFWGSRLALIQERYNGTKPRRLRQWWFDRRESNQWAHFWVAIVAILFVTVFFGIISSVTGIMQVWLSFKQFRQNQ